VPLLAARNLVKSYEGRTVVNQVSLSIEAGEIVGLLGRNGAGKTTTFRMVIGMITPEAGQVLFQDVEQNLLAILETQKLSRDARRERADELLSQFGLQHKAGDQARTCSGGERRRLEIARALVIRPKLLLLDEPFAGVDPHSVEELQSEVRRLADDGIALLITDHNVQQTLRICDRAFIIHDGKNLSEGTPREIINDPTVREAYLASTFRGDEFDERPARKRAPV
jgi:lipopolysaccharide export system ATP-binding protein